jgi:hypothetical protein
MKELMNDGQDPNIGIVTSIYRERYTGSDPEGVPQEYKAYEYEKQLVEGEQAEKLQKNPKLFGGIDKEELMKMMLTVPKPEGYDAYVNREKEGCHPESWKHLSEQLTQNVENRRKQKLEDKVNQESEQAKIPKEVRDQQWLDQEEKARQDRQKARMERQQTRDDLKKFLRGDKA